MNFHQDKAIKILAQTILRNAENPKAYDDLTAARKILKKLQKGFFKQYPTQEEVEEMIKEELNK